ncbi:hypothetical protein KIL84_021456 [Mauremys mutica]|uniref:Uncharacterized protein n=1 Tax=Mauremys mutica TaxID=74926 RepID=A0A9D3X7P8_9SAUR|nr:hypothetical protein KIL84_021456 [Mauremys mutica]
MPSSLDGSTAPRGKFNQQPCLEERDGTGKNPVSWNNLKSCGCHWLLPWVPEREEGKTMQEKLGPNGKSGEVEEAEEAAILLNDPALLSTPETAVKGKQDLLLCGHGHIVKV